MDLVSSIWHVCGCASVCAYLFLVWPCMCVSVIAHWSVNVPHGVCVCVMPLAGAASWPGSFFLWSPEETDPTEQVSLF